MKLFDVIGFPINLGCDKNGNELTPSILRRDGCYTSAKHQVNDLGDLPCTPRAAIIEEKYASHPKIKFLKPILTASRPLAERVMHSIEQQHIPLCVGGDHVMAFGSIAGVGLAKGADNYAVIYIDAHGDFNTEASSSTGNMHGMHLSYLMGYGEANIANFWGVRPLLNSKNIYFLGARALDPGEKERATKLNMYIRSSEQLNASDPEEVMDDILSDIKSKGIEHIHLSFDVDVIDPRYAPGTGVPEEDGITPALVYTLVRQAVQSDLVKSIDLVELNTNLDQDRVTERIMQQVLSIILEV
ncbi:putative arginase [Bacteroidales bacterium KA00251]|nr:putative arginase [Bacteroidales bacterium KA00251]